MIKVQEKSKSINRKVLKEYAKYAKDKSIYFNTLRSLRNIIAIFAVKMAF